MKRVFLTSDTHFSHQNILRFEAKNRPFPNIYLHNQELVARWNSVVNNDDVVWHLGDVFFGRDNSEVLQALNGTKHLVLGNHDHYGIQNYLPFFDKIVGCTQINHCILTHIPIHPSQFFRFKANIHGHLHSHLIDDARYFNVCVEQNNLTPMLLDDVFAKIERRLKQKL